MRPGPPRIDARLPVRIGRRVLVWVLRLLTGAVLRRYRPIVVAVTGSVGKTTTKDLTAAVLATRLDLRATEGSANSEIGVPATVFGSPRSRALRARARLPLDGLKLLLRRRRFPELLVLELAAGRPGELERLTRVVRPDVAVVTNVRPVHREFYADFSEIVREKSWPVRRLSAGGTAVLNRDDPACDELARLAPGRVLTYGANEGDVTLADVRLRTDGTTALLRAAGREFSVTTRLLGRHQLSGALAAVAVGLALGVPPEEAAAALEGFEPRPGRLRAVSGRAGVIVLDDCHNASPQAVVDALEVLSRFPGPRWAVLGDMLDLGPDTETGHRTVGEAAATRADKLVVVGERAAWIAEAALEEGMGVDDVSRAPDAAAASALVASQVGGGTVLVKGSAAVGLEAVVAALAPEAEIVTRGAPSRA